MAALSSVKICLYCDKPIEGVALPVGQAGAHASANGARPDNWRHVKGDPACRPRAR
ncbi:hypothetical protein N4G70_22300 [Streptomyces sp. ASQP_92]|uniref:hypothetical protein n=1 Tax=Streptomyces sp. ASQP_92 TaxID=2979116 RepID=UPI0021BEB6E7|nr:hypothetical protein [Streptomyces sp. ASQP_92]MCT9091579.1 hypothetical protein [Streptomyces sp. ASQP_92]